MDLRFQVKTKEKKGVKVKKKSLESKTAYNNGRWSIAEHFKFIKAFLQYANDWRRASFILKLY